VQAWLENKVTDWAADNRKPVRNPSPSWKLNYGPFFDYSDFGPFFCSQAAPGVRIFFQLFHIQSVFLANVRKRIVFQTEIFFFLPGKISSDPTKRLDPANFSAPRRTATDWMFRYWEYICQKTGRWQTEEFDIKNISVKNPGGDRLKGSISRIYLSEIRAVTDWRVRYQEYICQKSGRWQPKGFDIENISVRSLNCDRLWWSKKRICLSWIRFVTDWRNIQKGICLSDAWNV